MSLVKMNIHQQTELKLLKNKKMINYLEIQDTWLK
jgi:hypothetical protein